MFPSSFGATPTGASLGSQQHATAPPAAKVVLVGNAGSGKTALAAAVSDGCDERLGGSPLRPSTAVTVTTARRSVNVPARALARMGSGGATPGRRATTPLDDATPRSAMLPPSGPFAARRACGSPTPETPLSEPRAVAAAARATVEAEARIFDVPGMVTSAGLAPTLRHTDVVLVACDLVAAVDFAWRAGSLAAAAFCATRDWIDAVATALSPPPPRKQAGAAARFPAFAQDAPSGDAMFDPASPHGHRATVSGLATPMQGASPLVSHASSHDDFADLVQQQLSGAAAVPGARRPLTGDATDDAIDMAVLEHAAARPSVDATDALFASPSQRSSGGLRRPTPPPAGAPLAMSTNALSCTCTSRPLYVVIVLTKHATAAIDPDELRLVRRSLEHAAAVRWPWLGVSVAVCDAVDKTQVDQLRASLFDGPIAAAAASPHCPVHPHDSALSATPSRAPSPCPVSTLTQRTASARGGPSPGGGATRGTSDGTDRMPIGSVHRCYSAENLAAAGASLEDALGSPRQTVPPTTMDAPAHVAADGDDGPQSMVTWQPAVTPRRHCLGAGASPSVLEAAADGRDVPAAAPTAALRRRVQRRRSGGSFGGSKDEPCAVA